MPHPLPVCRAHARKLAWTSVLHFIGDAALVPAGAGWFQHHRSCIRPPLAVAVAGCHGGGEEPAVVSAHAERGEVLAHSRITQVGLMRVTQHK